MSVRFLLRSAAFLAILAAATPTPSADVPQPVPEPEVKPSDTDALTIFRHGADAHGILSSNWSTGDACTGHWLGVGCSADGRRVTSLTLPSLDLRGPLDPLSHLAELRALDLRGNRLNGTLDALLRGAPGLVLLYLSRNDVSGRVPADALARLTRLVRLDLADNSLSGGVPSAAALAGLTALVTLRLQDNLLTGLVPDVAAALPRLAEFNASNNQLSGRVPDAMRARFGLASFAGNAGLCGAAPPLPPCSFLPREPAPTPPSSSVLPSVVPSNPAASSSVASSSPALATPESLGGARGRSKGGLSPGAVAGIAVGNALFFLALASLLVACCCCGRGGGDGEPAAAKKRKRRGRVGLEDGGGGGALFGHLKGEQQQPGRPGSAGRCSDGGDSDGARSKLVFFGADGGEDDDDDGDGDSDGSAAGAPLTSHLQQQGRQRGSCRFQLEELLRASAEMVGRGSLGTVYRAVLSDGRMVAVKRLRDANPCARDEFHRYMDLIGRLRHPHLVPLRAFYYARQEKLLIYDYLPNGNLHDRLHGTVTVPSPATLFAASHCRCVIDLDLTRINRDDDDDAGHKMSGESALDWTTRVRLLLGAARGLACIHREYRTSGVPHGNVKSTNVLIDKDGAARVADFGLALLLSPAHAIARLGGYMAPEQADNKRLSQESDVYSFGVLILEALTGKAPAQHLHPPAAAPPEAHKKGAGTAMGLPEWVRSVVREEWTAEVFDVELLRYRDIEEEMVALLHVALACVAPRQDQRPSMGDVVRMIESVPVEQSPAPEEEDRDVSVTSPSIGVTTDDGDGGRLSSY